MSRYFAAWLGSRSSTRGFLPIFSAISIVFFSAATTSGSPCCAGLPMLIEKSEPPNCTMSMPGTDRIRSRSSTHDFFSTMMAITTSFSAST